MKIYENIEQGSEEWFAIRREKMTASHAQAIGNCGKGLDSYILEMMAESNSTASKINYSNPDTDRGHELEPVARSIYELENGVSVAQVGFIERDRYSGCSPDGLVGEDGLVEIKCLNDVNHFKIILRENDARVIPSKYVWQVQMQLLITGRKKGDLVFYNPNFEKSLIVFPIVAIPTMHADIEKGLEIGRTKIEAIKKILK